MTSGGGLSSRDVTYIELEGYDREGKMPEDDRWYCVVVFIFIHNMSCVFSGTSLYGFCLNILVCINVQSHC